MLRVLSFADLPWIWLAPMLWFSGAMLPRQGIDWICLVWVGSLALAGALIQGLPSLRFVGEGFRYFEFAIVPLAVLVTRGIEEVGFGTRLALVPAVLAIGSIGVVQMVRNARASWMEGACRDERAVRLARRMRESSPARLLVLPLQYAPLVTVEANASTLMMLGERGADASEDFYPVMENPPEHFVSGFELDGVFLDRRYAEIEELTLPTAVLADEEGPYALYRLARARPESPNAAAPMPSDAPGDPPT
jgi:hypothetical protein